MFNIAFSFGLAIYRVKMCKNIVNKCKQINLQYTKS